MAQKPKGEAQKVTEGVVKFDKPGAFVEGKLLSVEYDVQTKMGDNVIYRLEDEAGVLQAVFGTTILRRLMQGCHVGDWVKITYTGEKGEGSRQTKLFDVERTPEEVGQAVVS